MPKITLPSKFRTKWLKALRSGEFKQARGYLRKARTGGYCCLGVAAVINKVPAKSLKTHSTIDDLIAEKIIPGNCPLARNLAEDKASSIRRDFVTNLMQANDNGASFEKIADYIEEQTVGV